jgi:hypothetical protein
VAVVSMSKQEFSRLEILLRVQSGRLRVTDACELTGLHRRQVFRLLSGLRQGGAASLLSEHRGKPGNHRLPAEVRTMALSIVRDRYIDFGPSLAAEKLAEHHGCTVSRETLRGWMIADGLQQDRRPRLPSPHQPRWQRDCLGELVQIDGSEHAWFEDRGPPCTLLGFVDCGPRLGEGTKLRLGVHDLLTMANSPKVERARRSMRVTVTTSQAARASSILRSSRRSSCAPVTFSR